MLKTDSLPGEELLQAFVSGENAFGAVAVWLSKQTLILKYPLI